MWVGGWKSLTASPEVGRVHETSRSSSIITHRIDPFLVSNSFYPLVDESFKICRGVELTQLRSFDGGISNFVHRFERRFHCNRANFDSTDEIFHY